MSIRPLRRAATLVAATAIVLTGCSSGSDGEGIPATTIAATTTLPPGITASIDELLVGQCFNEIPEPAQQPYAVLVVACEEAHSHEVYDTTTYDSDQPTGRGAAYPGDLAVANRSEEQCFATFEAFIGTPWETSSYDIQTFWPTAESWRAENDRNVVCSVFRVNGGVTTGSVRNSGE